MACHGPQRSAGHLALHTREAALKEGASGSPGIVPGQPKKVEHKHIVAGVSLLGTVPANAANNG